MRALENHHGHFANLLYLNQFPAVLSDGIEKLADLSSAVALVVVLRKLIAECFSAQGASELATGFLGIRFVFTHHLNNLVFPDGGLLASVFW